nr:hypothetical protein BaRGS_033558 [Batillaria attramentaria]
MAKSASDYSIVFIFAAFVCALRLAEVKGQLVWRRLHSGSHDDTANVSVTDVPPSRRDAILGYDVTRKQLVLFGGMPGPMDDTWIYSITSNEWREVNAPLKPPGRYGAVGGVVGHFFYVATGCGDVDTYYNDVWRFDLRQEQWELLPSMPEQSRFTQSAATTPTSINNTTADDVTSDPSINTTAATSNETSTSEPETEAQNANSDAEIASAKSDNGPPARYSAAGGVYVTGTRIYVTLGTASERVDETYAYDIASNTWYKGAGACGLYDPRCPHPRYLQSGLMTGRDELVIFSGCLSGGGAAGPCPSSDTWRYDGRTKHWTRLDGCPAPRLYGSMAMLPSYDGKRRAVLYGGQTDAHTTIEAAGIDDDEVAVLDLDYSGSWTVLRAASEVNGSGVPVLRVSAAMATGPDGVFLFGGSSHHGVYANDLWVLLGNATDADLSPTLPCAEMTVTLMTIHGILMTAGFGFFLPLGTLLARYVQNLYAHIAFQIAGLCCALAGLAVGVVSVESDHFSVVHAFVGIVALGLGVLQPVNALCRPKEPRPEELKGLARRIWEAVHRFGGRVALLLGVTNISLGIFMSLADLPIMITWHAWLDFNCRLSCLKQPGSARS